MIGQCMRYDAWVDMPEDIQARKRMLQVGCGSPKVDQDQIIANYVSLTKEKEIEIDFTFVSDFHEFLFDSHMKFNHSTDPNLEAEGFLIPHHLLQYHFLKVM